MESLLRVALCAACLLGVSARLGKVGSLQQSLNGRHDARALQLQAAVIAAAQARNISCANVGERMEELLNETMASVRQEQQALAGQCDKRKEALRQSLASQIDDHEQKRRRAIQNVSLRLDILVQPFQEELDRVAQEEQLKVDNATKANQTAWDDLAKDKAALQAAQKQLDAAKAKHSQNERQYARQANESKNDAQTDYDNAVADSSNTFNTAKETAARSRNASKISCQTDFNEATADFGTHKQILDKIVPLVDALKECRKGKGANKTGTTTAAPTAVALLEEMAQGSYESRGCREIAAKLRGSVLGGRATALLEVGNSAVPNSYDWHLENLRNKTRAAEDAHEQCKRDADNYFQARVQNASSAKSRADNEANALLQGQLRSIEQLQTDRTSASQANVTKAQQTRDAAGNELNGDAGSLAVALEKQEALGKTLADKAAAVAKEQEKVDEQKQKNNEALRLETVAFNTTKAREDALSTAQVGDALAGVEEECIDRDTYLKGQADNLATIQTDLLAITAYIDDDKDVITTTPAPTVTTTPATADNDATATTDIKILAAPNNKPGDLTEADASCKSHSVSAGAGFEWRALSSLDAESTAECNALKSSPVTYIPLVLEMLPGHLNPRLTDFQTQDQNTCEKRTKFQLTTFNSIADAQASIIARDGNQWGVLCKKVPTTPAGPTTTF